MAAETKPPKKPAVEASDSMPSFIRRPSESGKNSQKGAKEQKDTSVETRMKAQFEENKDRKKKKPPKALLPKEPAD